MSTDLQGLNVVGLTSAYAEFMRNTNERSRNFDAAQSIGLDDTQRFSSAAKSDEKDGLIRIERMHGNSYWHVAKTAKGRVQMNNEIHPAPQEWFNEEQIKEDGILRFFHYAHLPAGLQARSKPFCDLARTIIETTPRNPERTVALRKLLEAKDAAVRAGL